MDRLREEALHDVSTARGEQQEYEVASDDSAANSIATDLADFLGANDAGEVALVHCLYLARCQS